ncbi:ATP-grasp domain-containing protein [Haloferax sp. YSSS75]|uniref:ATP-grasp domain-containing protein n=1 Tax=Haloferax sp. YSSS75 TaxID=3388564 RepID=UPI00398D300F
MNGITVLITGCGAPGTIGTIWSLNQNKDNRSIRTIGTDVRDEQPGRFVCDEFHKVPPADSPNFVDELLSICDSEDVDVVLPQVTAELQHLSESRDRFASVGTEIAISNKQSVEQANSKKRLTDLCGQLGIPSPDNQIVRTWSQLRKAASSLGYPENPVVVKPPISNGQRGFRIITEDMENQHRFYEKKPDGTKISMQQLHAVLGDSFPELLVMEYLPGEELSVDVFRNEDQTVPIPRSRDRVRSGISFQTTIKRDTEIISYVQDLSEEIDLQYVFGFQFKRREDGTPVILECNPRIQGTMVASTVAGSNLIYAAVKEAIGETQLEFGTNWGSKFYRYWGGIGKNRGHPFDNIGEIE